MAGCEGPQQVVVVTQHVMSSAVTYCPHETNVLCSGLLACQSLIVFASLKEIITEYWLIPHTIGTLSM